MTHDFHSGILKETAHRPWPMPDRLWLMTQTWHDLLFAHWAVDPGELRRKVPSDFELDLYDGQAWVAVVPFRMTNVAPRGMPSMPWVSSFPELNLRTYVRVAGRPGVYFFSLDAGNPVAVHTARMLLNLPYFSAAMTVTSDDHGVNYESERRAPYPPAVFAARYAPTAIASAATHGSLEHFLTERYCLYHIDRRQRPYRLEIHHPPWALQPARADIRQNTMALVEGLRLPEAPPLLHFSKRQDVVAWAPDYLER